MTPKPLEGQTLALERTADADVPRVYPITPESDGGRSSRLVARLARWFAMRHESLHPDAERLTVATVRVQLLERVAELLDGADMAVMRTPWGTILAYDVAAVSEHTARRRLAVALESERENA